VLSHGAGEEYGIAPATSFCRLAFTKLFCHSPLRRLPKPCPLAPEMPFHGGFGFGDAFGLDIAG